MDKEEQSQDSFVQENNGNCVQINVNNSLNWENNCNTNFNLQQEESTYQQNEYHKQYKQFEFQGYQKQNDSSSKSNNNQIIPKQSSGGGFMPSGFANFGVNPMHVIGAYVGAKAVESVSNCFLFYQHKQMMEKQMQMRNQIINKQIQLKKDFLQHKKQVDKAIRQNKFLKLQYQKLKKNYQEKQNQIAKQNQKLSKDLQAYKQQYKNDKDPQKYKENRQNSFKVYIQSISSLVKDTKPLEGKFYVGLLGKISAGKSSLLNFLFNLDLQVGVGETTTEKTSVYQIKNNNVEIWDCPGMNQDTNTIFNPSELMYFASCNLVLILYSESPKCIKELCVAMYKLRPNNIAFVRTKCDLRSKKDKKTIEQELQTDKNLLESWGIKLAYPIFATSAENEYRDNQKLKKLMLNEKQ